MQAQTTGIHCFPTALGTMAIAWEGAKIIATQLPEKTERALLAAMRRKLNDPLLTWSDSAPFFVRRLASMICAHLDGKPQKFPLHLLALERHSPFFQRVYACAGRIPPGELRTYGELAAAAGSHKAFRAVGQAMARNPYPLLIPCHRVVGGNRALVGFSAHGGVTTKSRLLKLESCRAGTHHQP
jgi:methylated-DNA-[protein]-cysteine S-methyltransferase